MLLNGLCWSYGKNNSKPLLSAYSMHPKSVKHGPITTLFLSAFHKSCFHEVSGSVAKVQKRLLTVGFTFDCIMAVTTRLLHRFQSKGDHKKGISTSERVAVIPFFYSVTNNLEASEKRFVKVVCKNGFKLSKLTLFQSASDDSCKKKHKH